MNNKTFIRGMLLLCSSLMAISWLSAQTIEIQPRDARMFRYPAISEQHIAFVYAGDIWLAPLQGGTAHKLTTAPGEELFPRFSPDGTELAFTANYDGSASIYVMPVSGGIPRRLTWHGSSDRCLGWTPNGSQVLFASSRESGNQRFNQLFTIPREGGQAIRLPVPYGEAGAISPDGQWLAYMPKSRDFRTWKRYEGGMVPDIWLFNLSSLDAERITGFPHNDASPMWHGDLLYFLSDRDEYRRNNIWAYDTRDKSFRQVSHFTDFDIRFPSISETAMVFEAGGRLYRMSLEDESYQEVSIRLITDNQAMRERTIKADARIEHSSLSHDGNRVIIGARGEIFSLPREHGPVFNLSQTSGIAERYPTWSPDGTTLAYWSDRSGEYELYIRNLTDSSGEQQLSQLGPGFRYAPQWSPDGRFISFIDQEKRLFLLNTENRQLTEIDQDLWMNHGALQGFRLNWSSDSRWMSYSRALDNRNSVIFVYDTRDQELHQITSDFYSHSDPVFDTGGNYLFAKSYRHFSPSYSAIDNTWIYANATQLVAFPLLEKGPSPLAPRNDSVSITDTRKDLSGQKQKAKNKKEEEPADDAGSSENVNIDLDGFESRAVILPVDPGNFGQLAASDGKLIFHRLPNTGSSDSKRPLMFYDLEAREEKTIIDDVHGFELSADGKKLLLRSGSRYAVVNVAERQEMKTLLRTAEMQMNLNPRQEWEQIFMDAWRLTRDFFYDRNMHGVDWEGIRDQYKALLPDAVSRYDVNFIIGELIAELNASHAYRGGGDTEDQPRVNVGYLGIDWELDQGSWKIGRIIRGASWDAEVRSPLAAPDLGISEGMYILAVNGQPLSATQEPFAAFQHLAGTIVELTINSEPRMEGARRIVVETLRSEARLRHLAWIEQNRLRVEEASQGRLGYIYVPSTGVDGQNELVRQFNAQFTKDGLIIDERFNSGGQIPDRFIELLNREPLVYWSVRSGKDWPWPPYAHFGPKAMLINGWSGSGGDAFPDYFRQRQLGPLIGQRTWGGLIGISGTPALIDGGSVSVPTFRMYYQDGEWFPEGHGVDPDIDVVDDPAKLARGIDPQLEAAIEYLLEKLDNEPYQAPRRPQPEDRRAPAFRN